MVVVGVAMITGLLTDFALWLLRRFRPWERWVRKPADHRTCDRDAGDTQRDGRSMLSKLRKLCKEGADKERP